MSIVLYIFAYCLIGLFLGIISTAIIDRVFRSVDAAIPGIAIGIFWPVGTPILFTALLATAIGRMVSG